MRRTSSAITAFSAAAFTAAAAFAQEGFPLDGTWRGVWGAAEAGTHVVIVMDWDGERINGLINPGPRSIPFRQAALQPATWTVRIEALGADAAPILIEGTLEDIGSYSRYISGTWSQGGEVHPFRITREWPKRHAAGRESATTHAPSFAALIGSRRSRCKPPDLRAAP